MAGLGTDVLSNAELHDIASRRAADDDDVARLIAFVLHLKRKGG